MDPAAAALIHPNDAPKIVRALEVTLANRSPITRQWAAGGRDPLAGYRTLRLALNPSNHSLRNTSTRLTERFGAPCRPFSSLGYRQAAAVIAGELSQPAAIAEAQQGHRNYSKRQLTWFRADAAKHPTHWLEGFGDDEALQQQALRLALAHLGDECCPAPDAAPQAEAPQHE